MRFCTRKRIFYKKAKDPRAEFCITVLLSQLILYINAMDINEFFAWLFIVFSVICYIFRNTNKFFAGCWFVLKGFYIALFAVLAYGFVIEQITKK